MNVYIYGRDTGNMINMVKLDDLFFGGGELDSAGFSMAARRRCQGHCERGICPVLCKQKKG